MNKSLFFKISTFTLSLVLFFYGSFVLLSYLMLGVDPFSGIALSSSIRPEGQGSNVFSDDQGSNIFEKPKLNSLNKQNNSPFSGGLEEAERQDLNESTDQEDPNPALTASRELSQKFFKSPAGSILWPIAAFFFILSGFIYLCISLGWKKGRTKPEFPNCQSLPADLFGLILLASLAINISFTDSAYAFFDSSVYFFFPYPELYLAFALSLIFALSYAYVLLLVAQIKVGTLFKSTLIFRFFSFCLRLVKSLLRLIKTAFSHLPEIMVYCLLFFAYLICNTVLLVPILTHSPAKPLALVLFTLLNLSLSILVIRFIINYKRVKNFIIDLANGKPLPPLDPKLVSADFANLVLAVNRIKSGQEMAISEKQRSDIFRTELITNVSHDIKTPLTSIIMYAELLKRENLTDPKVRQYVEVLAKQSDRLKNLIEDLIEASKISTGSVKVKLLPMDIKQFLEQVYAEYEPKLSADKLKLVMTSPNEDYLILADSKYFIRVFDNLFSNIIKYAQAESRVYLDVISLDQNYLQIRLRNVSAEKITVSAEQLLERFVQGDSSRSKGGSGIGLSIAKNLIEAQHGQLSLQVDGDLFTIDLKVPKYLGAPLGNPPEN